MSKIKLYTLIAFLAIVFIVAVIPLFNPLRWPQECIKNGILKLTPIGTSMEDVIKIIESKWENDSISYYDEGYRKPGPPDPSDIGRGTIVGEKSIEVFIGEYRNVFATCVSVFWVFDENSELIEIFVEKDTDAI